LFTSSIADPAEEDKSAASQSSTFYIPSFLDLGSKAKETIYDDDFLS